MTGSTHWLIANTATAHASPSPTNTPATLRTGTAPACRASSSFSLARRPNASSTASTRAMGSVWTSACGSWTSSHTPSLPAGAPTIHWSRGMVTLTTARLA